MPSLSPTMEAGSIANWLLKEGDRFEAGYAICEVETDKATVTYDATEDGYIAKILVGTGEVKVGQPLMITVEEAGDVSAFKDYTSPSASSSTKPTVSTPVSSSPIAATPANTPVISSSTPSAPSSGNRIFVSPLAKKLSKDNGVNLNQIQGSGPNNRIIASDILTKNYKPNAVVSSAPHKVAAPVVASTPVIDTSILSTGIYQDFSTTEIHRELASRFTYAKQVVPHYYLSVDLNLSALIKLRDDLNSNISVLDLLIKSTALAVKQVPDVNGSWKETYVRRYEQVDINVVVGSGDGLVTPVIRDVNSKGLNTIAKEISSFHESISPSSLGIGTFTVHNLGIYGIKSAAPIVLPPQACALAFGSINDTVIPKANPKDGEDNWTVAPVLTATLSCDHRVIDGAVGAQYLQAFKTIVENPLALLL
eukprot:gene18209-23874_t